MPLIYMVCCYIIQYLRFLKIYLACFFFTVFVCADENECLARCLVWQLYECTVDPKTHTRQNVHGELEKAMFPHLF